jgi:hypothetical protein
MLLERARSVHTLGMRFPIVVAVLDRELTVLGTRLVPPGRFLRPRQGARHVLEVPRGTDVRAGDRLLREQGADQGEHGERGEGQGCREDGGEVTRPRRQGDRLPPARVRPDDPEELQQRTHVDGPTTSSPSS